MQNVYRLDEPVLRRFPGSRIPSEKGSDRFRLGTAVAHVPVAVPVAILGADRGVARDGNRVA